MYQLYKDSRYNIVCGAVLLDETGQNKAFLFDPANTDYQQYLAWLAEGNEPLPADEVQ